MDTDGPLESHKLLRKVLDLTKQVRSLRHVSEDQISNFFATYVRALRASLSNSGQGLDEVSLSLDYFSSFWGLCTAQYSNLFFGNVLSLFKATIRKLDNIDNPLCLWIFLVGSGISQNLEDPDVGQLYLAMEAELNVRMPDQDLGVLPVFMTVQFLLSVGHKRFFDIMHDLMRAQGKIQTWRCVWRVCQRPELYTVLSQHAEVNAQMNDFVLENVMA
ncbi:MAG: hypothetical protein Q9164_007830 [Protoblastenia rupestris]